MNVVFGKSAKSGCRNVRDTTTNFSFGCSRVIDSSKGTSIATLLMGENLIISVLIFVC